MRWRRLLLMSLLLPAIVGMTAVGCEQEKLPPLDEQALRELAACGDPSLPPGPPPGTYVDQGTALDYARMVPDDDPENGDRKYMYSVVGRPAGLEQLYHDATQGEARAAWLVCQLEAIARGLGRGAAKTLADLRCQTVRTCEFRPRMIPLSESHASGARMLGFIVHEFQAKALEKHIQQSLIANGIALLGVRGVLRAAPRPVANPPSPGGTAAAGRATAAKPAPKVRVHMGQQGKHIPGHNNFDPIRSPFTHPDPQGLLDRFAGTGTPVSKVPRGQPGFRERVDFREVIGTIKGQPTTKGIIHYSKAGAHIVPANP